MMDFAFYHLNEIMLQREAQGLPAFLKDKDGKKVSLCNDGDVYCNVTRYTGSAMCRDSICNSDLTGPLRM